jgi:hypothetical protein
VKDRIRVIETEKERSASEAADKNQSRALTDSRRSEDERQGADQGTIARTLANIRELRSAGKIDEANRLAQDLASRFPVNSAVQTTQRNTSFLDQLAAARKLRADHERRTSAVVLDVLRSATPATGDVEYPKDWAEKTKTRAKSLNPLTAKEYAIMGVLNSPITVNFKESRFEDVIDYLQTVLRQPIIMDKNALDEARVTYDSPVTVNVKGVAVRTLLRKILSDFGLTYIVKDEVVQVVSATKAKEMMVSRSYYLGDVVAGQAGAVFFGAGFDQFQTLQNANRIIDLIQTSVDPQSWQINGGPGQITFHAPTLTLVVRQSAEVHAMLGGALFP